MPKQPQPTFRLSTDALDETENGQRIQKVRNLIERLNEEERKRKEQQLAARPDEEVQAGGIGGFFNFWGDRLRDLRDTAGSTLASAQQAPGVGQTVGLAANALDFVGKAKSGDLAGALSAFERENNLLRDRFEKAQGTLTEITAAHAEQGLIKTGLNAPTLSYYNLPASIDQLREGGRKGVPTSYRVPQLLGRDAVTNELSEAATNALELEQSLLGGDIGPVEFFNSIQEQYNERDDLSKNLIDIAADPTLVLVPYKVAKLGLQSVRRMTAAGISRAMAKRLKRQTESAMWKALEEAGAIKWLDDPSAQGKSLREVLDAEGFKDVLSKHGKEIDELDDLLVEARPEVEKIVDSLRQLAATTPDQALKDQIKTDWAAINEAKDFLRHEANRIGTDSKAGANRLRDLTIAELLNSTGERMATMIGLTNRDIDNLLASSLHSKQGGGVVNVATQTGKGARLLTADAYIFPQEFDKVSALLREYKSVRPPGFDEPDDFFFVGFKRQERSPVGITDEKLVKAISDGRRQEFSDAWREIGKSEQFTTEAGSRLPVPAKLRAARALNLVTSEKVSLENISSLLRHDSVTTTVNFYLKEGINLVPYDSEIMSAITRTMGSEAGAVYRKLINNKKTTKALGGGRRKGMVFGQTDKNKAAEAIASEFVPHMPVPESFARLLDGLQHPDAIILAQEFEDAAKIRHALVRTFDDTNRIMGARQKYAETLVKDMKKLPEDFTEDQVKAAERMVADFKQKRADSGYVRGALATHLQNRMKKLEPLLVAQMTEEIFSPDDLSRLAEFHGSLRLMEQADEAAAIQKGINIGKSQMKKALNTEMGESGVAQSVFDLENIQDAERAVDDWLIEGGPIVRELGHRNMVSDATLARIRQNLGKLASVAPRAFGNDFAAGRLSEAVKDSRLAFIATTIHRNKHLRERFISSAQSPKAMEDLVNKAKREAVDKPAKIDKPLDIERVAFDSENGRYGIATGTNVDLEDVFLPQVTHSPFLEKLVRKWLRRNLDNSEITTDTKIGDPHVRQTLRRNLTKGDRVLDIARRPAAHTVETLTDFFHNGIGPMLSRPGRILMGLQLYNNYAIARMNAVMHGIADRARQADIIMHQIKPRDGKGGFTTFFQDTDISPKKLWPDLEHALRISGRVEMGDGGQILKPSSRQFLDAEEQMRSWQMILGHIPPEKWDEFYTFHNPKMKPFLHHILNERYAAEDMIDDAFNTFGIDVTSAMDERILHWMPRYQDSLIKDNVLTNLVSFGQIKSHASFLKERTQKTLTAVYSNTDNLVYQSDVESFGQYIMQLHLWIGEQQARKLLKAEALNQRGFDSVRRSWSRMARVLKAVDDGSIADAANPEMNTLLDAMIKSEDFDAALFRQVLEAPDLARPRIQAELKAAVDMENAIGGLNVKSFNALAQESNVLEGLKFTDHEIKQITKLSNRNKVAAAALLAKPITDYIRFMGTGFDLGVNMIHGIAVLADDPKIWAKSSKEMYKAFTDPDNFSTYFTLNREAANEFQLAGGIVGITNEAVQLTPQQMRPIQDMLGAVEKLAAKSGHKGSLAVENAMGKVLGIDPQAIRNRISDGHSLIPDPKKLDTNAIMRFQASYNTFLETARIEMWKALSPGITDPTELKDLAMAINKGTGVMNTAMTGLTPSTSTIQSTVLFFAPMYRKAVYATIFDLIPRRGARPAQRAAALKRMRRLFMIGGVFGSIAYHTGNNRDVFDPTSPRFMSWRVSGDRPDLEEGAGDGGFYIGLGSAYYAMARLAATIAKTGHMLITEPEERSLDQKRLDDRVFNSVVDNPYFQLVRGQSSPLASIGMDFFFGRNFRRDPLRDPETLGPVIQDVTVPDWVPVVGGNEYPMPITILDQIGDNGLPFWLDKELRMDWNKGGAVAGLAEFMGMRTTPISDWEHARDLRDLVAQERIHTILQDPDVSQVTKDEITERFIDGHEVVKFAELNREAQDFLKASNGVIREVEEKIAERQLRTGSLVDKQIIEFQRAHTMSLQARERDLQVVQYDAWRGQTADGTPIDGVDIRDGIHEAILGHRIRSADWPVRWPDAFELFAQGQQTRRGSVDIFLGDIVFQLYMDRVVLDESLFVSAIPELDSDTIPELYRSDLRPDLEAKFWSNLNALAGVPASDVHLYQEYVGNRLAKNQNFPPIAEFYFDALDNMQEYWEMWKTVPVPDRSRDLWEKHVLGVSNPKARALAIEQHGLGPMRDLITEHRRRWRFKKDNEAWDWALVLFWDAAPVHEVNWDRREEMWERQGRGYDKQLKPNDLRTAPRGNASQITPGLVKDWSP